MCNIPRKLSAKYDFVWSNCALGHLGSIPDGIKFIEESLKCLKPGGWAVHTTEVNIGSNDVTAESGATVVFRLTDLYQLGKKLSSHGYICSPFHLLLGNSKLDNRVSLDPVLGNDYSKIFINGHIASQIVLIIHKPVKKLNQVAKLSNRLKHYNAYKTNKVNLRKIVRTNPTIILLRKSRGLKPNDYIIRPVKKLIELNNKDRRAIIEYVNESAYALTGLHESLFNVKHIILGTDEPVNHASPLANTEWFMTSRPSLLMNKKTKTGWAKTGYVKPGEHFSFVFPINSRLVERGYIEHFSVIQEGGGIIPNSTVSLKIV
jgi:hypothetical protein